MDRLDDLLGGALVNVDGFPLRPDGHPAGEMKRAKEASRSPHPRSDGVTDRDSTSTARLNFGENANNALFTQVSRPVGRHLPARSTTVCAMRVHGGGPRPPRQRRASGSRVLGLQWPLIDTVLTSRSVARTTCIAWIS